MSFEGDVTLPQLVLLGGLSTEGEFILPLLSMLGSTGSECSFNLPSLLIQGKFQDFIIGSCTLPTIRITGEIGVSAKIDCSINIPMFFFSGEMQAEGNIDLYCLSVFGYIQRQGIITASIKLPPFQLSGVAEEMQWMYGSIMLPGVVLVGVVSQALNVITGDATIPLLLVKGVCISTAENNYGNESDVVLRYSSTRRLI